MFLTGFNLATVVDLHMFVLSVVVGYSLLCRCMSYLCVFYVCLLCVIFVYMCMGLYMWVYMFCT